jgi:hypothetical protein
MAARDGRLETTGRYRRDKQPAERINVFNLYNFD